MSEPGSPIEGRVVRVSGLQCLVETGDQQWTCNLRGRIKAGARQTTSPVIVGDWVEVLSTAPGAGVVAEIRPRRSRFSRLASGPKPYEQVVAVNLDQLVVVVAIRNPALRVGFIDRALVMALKGGMEAAICINKVDLDPAGDAGPVADVYRNLGHSVCLTSAHTGEGVGDFEAVLRDRDSVVVGQSGVGKSSLLNRLDPDLAIKTRELMTSHDRGRHTTAAVQLYPLKGSRGHVADTPGIKELQLWQVERSSLVEYFAEMAPLVGNCRFRDCAHLSEPDCAVREAVERGEIAPIRYEAYQRIIESVGQSG